MDYLLSFSIILTVLWAFYKIALENTSWHVLKRFYLITIPVIAASIPLIVVRELIVPIATVNQVHLSGEAMDNNVLSSAGLQVDWILILWTVYGLGVLIMGIRFFKNLYELQIKTTDELEKYHNYLLVLRSSTPVPHSFLNKIYAQVDDYKSNAIPEIVLEHEKAHLDQRHSWDIVFIELLLIVLWFNPLVYLLKFSIKLNHEFLADQAVLRNGHNYARYQRTLLAFAASDSYKTIANTFNFPIIKKRFTIMNTKTSSASLLLRSLALIPVIALLVISCGKEEVVEKPETLEVIEVVETASNHEKVIFIDPAVKNGEVMVNNSLYRYDIKNDQVVFTDTDGNIVDLIEQGYEIVEAEIEIVEVLEEVTPEDITDYNRLAKKHKQYINENQRIMVWSNETSRMQTIWNSMNAEQKAENEPWPFTGTFYNVEYKDGQIPPPPPPQDPAILTVNKDLKFIKVDGVIKSYATKSASDEYYNHEGVLINTKGKTVEEIDASDVPPPPPPAKKKSDNSTGFNAAQKAAEVSDWAGNFEKGYKKNAQTKVGSLEDWRTIDYLVIDEYDVSLIDITPKD